MNWSYIAGFFDGEGSVAHNGKGFRITIAQTDLEILNLIKDFTGVGHVIEVTKRKKHWKKLNLKILQLIRNKKKLKKEILLKKCINQEQ